MNEVFGPKNVVLASHYPVSRSSSPAASVYQAWVRPESPFELRGFVDVTQPDDLSWVSSLASDTTVLFNSMQSLLSPRSAELLSRCIASNFAVAVYWHETAWNIRALGARAGDALDIALALLAVANPVHLVPTRQAIHPVALLTGSDLSRVFPVFEVVDLEQFGVREARANGPVRIVGSGAPDRRKGADIFWYIATALSPASAAFTWYSTSYTEFQPQFFSEWRDRSELVRWMPRSDDFQGALAENDIFVLTSRDDPSPLVAMEALATGLTVICFASTGIAEVVEARFVCSDLAEMRDCVRTVVEDGGLLSVSDARSIAEQYSVDTFAERLRSINASLSLPNPVPSAQLGLPGSYRLNSVDGLAAVAQSVVGSRASAAAAESSLASIRDGLDCSGAYAREQLRSLSRSRLRNSGRPREVVVVGNSPSAVDVRAGEVIDNADIVVRMNDFEVAGFEDYVGTRTTDLVLSPASRQSAGQLEVLDTARLILFKANYRWSRERTRQRMLAADGVGLDLSEVDTRWSGPLLIHLHREVGYLPGRWPSTGLAAIVYALYAFGRTGASVKLHGFSFGKESVSEVRHYHGRSSPIDGHHDFGAEARYVSSLARMGKVELIS